MKVGMFLKLKLTWSFVENSFRIFLRSHRCNSDRIRWRSIELRGGNVLHRRSLSSRRSYHLCDSYRRCLRSIFRHQTSQRLKNESRGQWDYFCGWLTITAIAICSFGDTKIFTYQMILDCRRSRLIRSSWRLEQLIRHDEAIVRLIWLNKSNQTNFWRIKRSRIKLSNYF